jgi:head-tail adaptor
MQSGKLDRTVTLQRKISTTSDAGSQVDQWNALALRRWASVRPVVGIERLGTDTLVAIQQVEFRIRYSPDIADLNPKDRLVYPALTADSPDPTAHTVYDILSVAELGRNEGFAIIAQRHADQP